MEMPAGFAVIIVPATNDRVSESERIVHLKRETGGGRKTRCAAECISLGFEVCQFGDR